MFFTISVRRNVDIHQALLGKFSTLILQFYGGRDILLGGGDKRGNYLSPLTFQGSRGAVASECRGGIEDVGGGARGILRNGHSAWLVYSFYETRNAMSKIMSHYMFYRISKNFY